jgi:uncharacterized membrane protein YgaE (UPF0421/DUF939 family)
MSGSAKREKLLFAFKASLALVVAFLYPMSQGWNSPMTAAITVMVIATMGSMEDSFHKGMLRIAGTVAGALIGLTLIALFPQERMLYLSTLSIVVTLFLYLARAYRGDPTLFMLTAMTIMIVYGASDAESSFIYGMERTFMTIFGIAVYTLTAMLIFPQKPRDSTLEAVERLALIQKEALENDYNEECWTEREKELDELETLMKANAHTPGDISARYSLSGRQWRKLSSLYMEADRLLRELKLMQGDEGRKAERLFPQSKQFRKDIARIFENIGQMWRSGEAIEDPPPRKIGMDYEKLRSEDIVDSAAVSAWLKHLQRLDEAARRVAGAVRSVLSSGPTVIDAKEDARAFVWLVPEDIKATLVTFLVFWCATIFWIYLNPVGGFMIVTLATTLSLYTSFSPLRPTILILLFSISFIYAVVMYIFVLPNLHEVYELALFLFSYAFIGFFLFPPGIAVFFLLGISTLGLSNEMNYDFALFLITLSIFYLFLFILLIFYYIPFYTKAQEILLTLRRRALHFSARIADARRGLVQGPAKSFARRHLGYTIEKIPQWIAALDEKETGTKRESLMRWYAALKRFSGYLAIVDDFLHRNPRREGHPIKEFEKRYNISILGDYLDKIAAGRTEEVDSYGKRLEREVETFMDSLEKGEYKVEEIEELYLLLGLHRRLLIAFEEYLESEKSLDFEKIGEKLF